MAFGAIAGGVLGYLGAKEQGDAARAGTGAAIGLQRDQFDYARQLQEALLRQQEPRRQASQNAMRSLSMMMGLGDPGGSAPVYQTQPQIAELQSLRSQLEGMDKFQSVQRPSAPGSGPGFLGLGPKGRRQGSVYTDEINPAYADLEQEIAALEAELGGGGGAFATTGTVSYRNPETGEIEQAPASMVPEGAEIISGGVSGGDGFTGPTSVTEMPGFQFFQEQGLDALASSGAARGMQLSGRQMEDISRFGQGLASQYRGQLIGELQSMAGMRPSTAPVSNLGNLAVGQAGAMSPLLQQQGMIGAAETAGTYGNLAGMLGEIDWGSLGNNTPSFGGYSGPPTQQSPVGGPMMGINF